MLSSNLLTLSPELHLSIISYLSLSNKRRLRLVCQIFNNLLILEVPFKDLILAQRDRTIFLVEDANEGELGFEPFIIMNVRKSYKDSKSNDSESASETSADVPQPGGGPAQPSFHLKKQHIFVTIFYPRYMRNDDEDERPEDEWEISINMEELSLSLDSDRLSSDEEESTRRVNYDLLRGKLVEASAALFRSRFVCPECGDSRFVCPGCGGFSRRFSSLFSGCGWSMPCPVCIGYEVADEARSTQRYDDEEELDALWKKIDKMLAKEKGEDGNESESSESADDED